MKILEEKEKNLYKLIDKLNIRNKQSGIYPSHLMLDYKSLPPTGKTLL